jgi:stage V sporulation protein S
VTEIKVASHSNPNSLAGAIAAMIREEGKVEAQLIGAAALNQAIKAVAIARGFLTPSGIDLICIPSFKTLLVDGEERTALRLVLEPR